MENFPWIEGRLSKRGVCTIPENPVVFEENRSARLPRLLPEKPVNTVLIYDMLMISDVLFGNMVVEDMFYKCLDVPSDSFAYEI